MSDRISIGDRKFRSIAPNKTIAQALHEAYTKPPDLDLGPGDAFIMEESTDQSPLDRVKSAILELPKESQREIYKFLYTLGHRMF